MLYRAAQSLPETRAAPHFLLFPSGLPCQSRLPKCGSLQLKRSAVRAKADRTKLGRSLPLRQDHGVRCGLKEVGSPIGPSKF